MPQIIQWSYFPLENNGPQLWLLEAKKRFHNPIIFACHGTSLLIPQESTNKEPAGKLTDEWYCVPDKPRQMIRVQTVVDTLRQLYPDNDIVVLCCNAKSLKLYGKRVYYSKTKTYNTPDDYLPWAWKPIRILQHKDEKSAGSIWDFVEGD
jgi:hypothetical protein